jgi:hypothetical protein
VTALAPSRQVAEPVVVFIAIDVRSGQYYLAAGVGMWLTVLCAATRVERRSFAAILAVDPDCAPANEPNNQRPPGMIFAVVDRHQKVVIGTCESGVPRRT